MATGTGLSLRDWLMSGKPTGSFFETVPRWYAGTDVAIAATGVMLTVAIPLIQGSVIKQVSYGVAGTAASTPTHSFWALYGPGATVQPLLVQSADGLTTAQAANTWYTVAFASSYTCPTTDVYYIGVSYTATAPPSLLGAATTGLNATNIIAQLAAFATAPPIAQTSGTALGGVAPATVASPTNVLTVPYLVLS